MSRFAPRSLLLLLFLGLLGAPLAAEEEATADRRVALPRHALQVLVPSGWEVDIHGEALVHLSRGAAAVWIRAGEGNGETALQGLERLAARVHAEAPDAPAPASVRWPVPGAGGARSLTYVADGQQRTHGVAPRAAGGSVLVEAYAPAGDADLCAALRGMLASVDLRAFEHPARHVDPGLGFTVDLPTGWTPSRGNAGEIRVRGPGAHLLRVARGPSETRAATAVLDAALARLSAAGLTVHTPEGGVDRSEATRTLDGKARQGAVQEVNVARGDAEGTNLLISAWVVGPLEVLRVRPANEAPVPGAVEILDTFRLGEHPGPLAAVLSRFHARRGPPLRFVLPDGWSVKPSTSRMRLGTFHIAEGVEGVAYFFGGGQGGTWEMNRTRWVQQWTDATEPKVTTLTPVDGLTMHILELQGRYTAPVRPGSPERVDQADHALVAVYLTTPDGPVMLKLVAPTAALAPHRASLHTWLRSFTLAP